MPDFIYDNINLGAASELSQVGLSATLLPTSVSGSAPSTVLAVTVGSGATQDLQVAFYVANITENPTLTFQPQLGAPPIASVQGTSVFASGVLPNGLFEIFYTVTIRRDQVAPGTGFIIPILTLGSISGTTAPVTVDLQ
jgi:hypothetical protein